MDTTLSAEYLKSEIKENSSAVPRHIAIIMDGNGRWAKKRGLPRTDGHQAGVRAVKKIVKAADQIGIGYLTLFTFSSENWLRPPYEVSALMQLLSETTRREIDELNENNVKLITTGPIEELPEEQYKILKEAAQKTKHNTGLVLNLALNYGGRDEILSAVRSIVKESLKGNIKPEDIDERMFSSHLFTRGLPDPDLLIRTSGEMRLSNFLLWQTSYTELYVTSTLWPDFDEEAFYMAILDYQRRERRFGKISPSSE